MEALLEAGRPDDALHRAIEGLASRLVPHQTVTLYDVAVRLLARARAKTHPGDVFDTYVMLVDLTLRSANQQSYRQAVTHLGELRRAARAAGRGEEYADLVARLLDQHRRRPTLVEMLRRLPT